MESQITGTILSVSGRTVGNNKTIYDIAFSDGNKYSTFDGALAQKAGALQGQQVSANVKVEQKGNYTNFYLNDIGAAGTLAAPAPAAGTPISITGAAPAPAVNIPIQSQETQTQKDGRIALTSSVKYAQELVSSLYQGAGPEALDQALESINKAGEFFYGLLNPQVKVQPPQAVVPATPEAVAAEVNAQAGSEVVIPWGQTA